MYVESCGLVPCIIEINKTFWIPGIKRYQWFSFNERSVFISNDVTLISTNGSALWLVNTEEVVASQCDLRKFGQELSNLLINRLTPKGWRSAGRGTRI